MKCQDHPNGCGFHLQLGDVLFVDGSEMELVKGSIIYMSVRKLDHQGVRTCKVGIMKAIPGQINLFCNRVGIVSKQCWRRGDTMLVKEPAVPEGWSYPFPRRGDAKEPKTLEICQSVGDYAVMTFIDGGRSTTVPVRPNGGYHPPTSFPAGHEMGLKVDPMELALNQVNLLDDTEDEVESDGGQMGRGKKGRKSEESASSAGSTKSKGNKKRKSEDSAGSSASVKVKKSKGKK
jgi:hypothetical protein